MINPEQISSIMAELGLSADDQNARKVIERLLASRPDVPVNEQFFARVREELQERGNTVAASQQSFVKSGSFSALFMNKILASALVVMIVVAAGGFWYIQNRTDKPLFQSPQAKEANQLLSGKYVVSSVAGESFGDLNKVSIVNAKDVSNITSSKSGEASSNVAVSPVVTDAPPEKLIAPGEPYPGPIQYSFKYVGKDLPQLDETQGVLKRAQPKQPATLIERIISMLSFGLVDLSKFQDVKLQSFSFIEDHDYGYNINVDMVNGSVGIYQNWERWPQPYATEACLKGLPECNPYLPIKPSDYPANEDMFKVTDAFLDQYGISKEAYGAPTVSDNGWRVMYERATEDQKASIYIPEQVTVIYPLMLDGQMVYDESGQPNGLTLTYDIRQRRVTNVYELTTKQFEKSQYQGLTDKEKILDSAVHGGFRNYNYPLDQANFGDQKIKNAELRLGTPTIRYVKLWYTDPSQTYSVQQNNELYVPALVFPIQNWEENGYWKSNIIVPLVKSVFESDYNNYPQPMPVDIPEMITNNTGGSSGTEAAPAVLPKAQ